MPLFKFRIYWEEDDNIYRDIILKKGQTFLEFHTALLKAFEFAKDKPSSFYESNDKWVQGREISSEVVVNKRGAAALSMQKTPVSALVEKPEQKFVYIYDTDKKWTFLIALIGLEKGDGGNMIYPFIAKSEGIAPSQTQIKGLANERLLEIEEKYDLNKEDMDGQGFSEDQVLGPQEENNS